MFFNPMVGYTILYRDVMYYGKSLNTSIAIHVILYSIIVFILGYLIFQKLQKRFSEIL